jgi:hypothetical protein
MEDDAQEQKVDPKALFGVRLAKSVSHAAFRRNASRIWQGLIERMSVVVREGNETLGWKTFTD